MIFDTEDEVAKWLIQQEEDYRKEQDKMNNAILSDRAGYDVQTEEEWKEILKYHNMPYYPRYPQKRAEETFIALRSYFEDKTERPSFCRRAFASAKSLVIFSRSLSVVGQTV